MVAGGKQRGQNLHGGCGTAPAKAQGARKLCLFLLTQLVNDTGTVLVSTAHIDSPAEYSPSTSAAETSALPAPAGPGQPALAWLCRGRA